MEFVLLILTKVVVDFILKAILMVLWWVVFLPVTLIAGTPVILGSSLLVDEPYFREVGREYQRLLGFWRSTKSYPDIIAFAAGTGIIVWLLAEGPDVIEFVQQVPQ